MYYTGMLFSILWIPLLVCVVAYVATSDKENKKFFSWFAYFISMLPTFFVWLTAIVHWGNHADNLAIIKEQHRMIAVYEQQKRELKATLESFEFPKGAVFNADSPVASIVRELANTERELAKVRALEGEVYRKIEATRLGLMSGVIDWVGDVPAPDTP